MSTTVTAPATPPPAPARAYWIPAAVILLAAVIGAGLVLSVWGELPDPIAHHWGADGKPNQWGPLLEQFLFAVGFSALFPLGMLGLGTAIKQPRALGAVAAGLGVFLSLLFFTGLYAQRGLADASAAPEVGWLIWAGAVGGTLVGLLVWVAVRDTTHYVAARGPAVDAPLVDVAPGTRLAWTGRMRAGTGLWLGLGLGTVPLVVLAGVFGAYGNWSLAGFMLVMLLAILVLMSNMVCRITIDARGLRARGLGIVPWVTVPLESVEEATTSRVTSPLGDFGGWGYRGKADGSGEWGLVSAAGEALVVSRAGKGRLWITVDGAEAAAAVLNTLVNRLDGRGSRPQSPLA